MVLTGPGWIHIFHRGALIIMAEFIQGFLKRQGFNEQKIAARAAHV